MKNLVRVVSCVLLVAMLSVAVFADSFTASVTQKDAPVVTKSAEVVAADGTKVEVKASDIKVESVAAKDMTPEVKAELDKAYDVIAKAESLEKAVPELKTVLEEAKIDVPVANLVVRDLVNVSVSEDVAKLLETEGTTITVSFKLDVKEGTTVVVMRFVDGKWVPVALENVTVNKDGTVDVKLDGVGPIAFLVENKYAFLPSTQGGLARLECCFSFLRLPTKPGSCRAYLRSRNGSVHCPVHRGSP